MSNLMSAEIRLLFFLFLGVALGAFAFFKALVAHRRSVPYRFGALDGGMWLTGKEVPAGRVLVASSVYLASLVAFAGYLVLL